MGVHRAVHRGQHHEVCEAARWWYLPHAWIGCAGFFVDKADGAVSQLGSCHGLDLCFWAHERGFRYPCDLVVESVTDLDAATSFLAALPLDYPGSRYYPGLKYSEEAIRSGLTSSLPTRYQYQELWFELPRFCEMETSPVFRYRLELPTTSASADAPRVLLDEQAFRVVADQPRLCDELEVAMHEGVVELMMTYRLRHTCIDSDETAATKRRRSQVPCRMLSADWSPKDEDVVVDALIHTGARYLVTTDIMTAKQRLGDLAGVRVIRLAKISSLLG